MDTRTFAEGAKGRLPFTQTFQTVNNITERAKVTGTITISDATGGGTTIFVQGECVVKITGLGGKVEGNIVENLKNAYRRLPLIVEEWMSVRHLHIADMSPIPVGSPMSGAPRLDCPTAPVPALLRVLRSFPQRTRSSLPARFRRGGAGRSPHDNPRKVYDPRGHFRGFFTTPGAQGSRDGDAGGRTHAHAFEPDTPENTPMLVRHAYRHADDLDSADVETAWAGWDSGRNAHDAGEAARARTRRGKEGRGVSPRVSGVGFFVSGGRAVAVGRGRRRRRGLVKPGSEENTATAEEEVMNPWEDARAAEDSPARRSRGRKKRRRDRTRTRFAERVRLPASSWKNSYTSNAATRAPSAISPGRFATRRLQTHFTAPP